MHQMKRDVSYVAKPQEHFNHSVRGLTERLRGALCCSEPISGNHNDAHKITVYFASQLDAI